MKLFIRKAPNKYHSTTIEMYETREKARKERIFCHFSPRSFKRLFRHDPEEGVLYEVTTIFRRTNEPNPNPATD